MVIKLTVESFLTGVRQSGLVDAQALDVVLARLRQQGELTDPEPIANELIARRLLTRWQSSKLLQGKFKGFVLGRYRLLDLLGRGEMSSVYLAEHIRMKRRCAIKVLPANKVRDTSYLGRFHREAEAVAALDHPNIVRAYDVDQENEAGTEIHFLAMEYVDGKDLVRLLAERERFTPFEAADYIRQAAEGLAHAHENGLIHRDIKPGNLLVDAKGTVKLLDLGLARFFRAHEEESLTIKHDEKVLGTADYLAPEQAVDSHAVDERADIYSLGCTFYFTLAGQPPFTDGTLVQRLLAHQTKEPPAISRFRDDVPEDLNAILLKMLRKSKEERFQSAREVADALARWLIANTDAQWRRQHPSVVASVAGMDDFLAEVQSRRKAKASEADEIVIPEVEPEHRTSRRLRPTGETTPVASEPAPRGASRRREIGTDSHQVIAAQRRGSADRPSPAPQPTRAVTTASAAPLPATPYPSVRYRPRSDIWTKVRALGRQLQTREGLMLVALVLVGIVLIAGMGASLLATARSEPRAQAVEEGEAPLESLSR